MQIVMMGGGALSWPIKLEPALMMRAFGSVTQEGMETISQATLTLTEKPISLERFQIVTDGISAFHKGTASPVNFGMEWVV